MSAFLLPFPLRLRRRFETLRRSLPATLIIGVAVAATLDLLRVIGPQALRLGDGLTLIWGQLPPWAATLAGLFVVVVVVGAVAVPVYGLFEALVLTLAFGRSAMGARLRRLARQDLDLTIEAVQQDLDVTRPFAVLLGLAARFLELGRLVEASRNLQNTELPALYEQTIGHIRQGWQQGAQGSILLGHVTTLDRLPLPAEPDRLRGQIVVANVTYLLGDLVEGRRLADRNIEEGEALDLGRLPVYQWLASYAHANSRLFLGRFEEAARLLGDRWQARYCVLQASDRASLRVMLRSWSMLDPLASVGRHVLLASAFAGRALRMRETEPEPQRPSACAAAWARRWYAVALGLGRRERISHDFARAYMALYCLLVDRVLEPRKELQRISSAAPPVSQYAKLGVRGLVAMAEGSLDCALADLRQADSYSRLSGNRFLEGILLPAHAAVAAALDPLHVPEARQVLRRARLRAKLARSAFYDSQIDAAWAVVLAAMGRKGETKRLWARARRTSHGLLGLYGRLVPSDCGGTG